jgi:hypothetical protein
MRLATQIVVLVLFVLCSLIAIAVTFSIRDTSLGLAATRLGIVGTALGTFLAAVAAIALVVRSLDGLEMKTLAGLAAAALVGLALVQVNWGLGLALGIVGAAALVVMAVARFRPRGEEESGKS